jgi:cytochrome c oxidase subunit 2
MANFGMPRRKIACEPLGVALFLFFIFTSLFIPPEVVYELSLLALAICAGIFLVTSGQLAYAILRFRQRPEEDGRKPPQVYGGTQIELAWTVTPILIVFVLLFATTRTIYEVQGATPTTAALNVTVVGHQGWWEIRYPELGLVTVNELHVPVSELSQRRPTLLKLESADVRHSLWVPQLADNKADLIPNRINQRWIEPWQTGTYVGNCVEYCGLQHDRMVLRVIVHTPEEFEKWVAERKQNSPFIYRPPA